MQRNFNYDEFRHSKYSIQSSGKYMSLKQFLEMWFVPKKITTKLPIAKQKQYSKSGKIFNSYCRSETNISCIGT